MTLEQFLDLLASAHKKSGKEAILLNRWLRFVTPGDMDPVCPIQLVAGTRDIPLRKAVLKLGLTLQQCAWIVAAADNYGSVPFRLRERLLNAVGWKETTA